MNINILKDAGKIVAGLSYIDHLRQAVSKILMTPDEIHGSEEISKGLCESIEKIKGWLQDVQNHLQTIAFKDPVQVAADKAEVAKAQVVEVSDS